MIVDKNTRSLEESTFLRLEEEILDGRLKKGDVVTETALSARLGVDKRLQISAAPRNENGYSFMRRHSRITPSSPSTISPRR